MKTIPQKSVMGRFQKNFRKGGEVMKRIINGLLAVFLTAAAFSAAKAEEMAAGAAVAPPEMERPAKQSPDVVTVVTADEIQRMGLRSLEDVLKRTVGFWTNTSRTEDVISSRGIDADGNNGYLIMIDGHRLNSVNYRGPGNQHVMPALAQVERVEIVRGPSSALWGDAAARGVINVITKGRDGADGSWLTGDYSTEDKQLSANYLTKGLVGKSGSYLFSFNWVKSDGYGEKGGHPNVFHGTGPDVTNIARWQDFQPSYELFAKVGTGKVTITARHLLWKEVNPDTSLFPDVNELRHEQSYLEVSHVKSLGESAALETKLYTDKQWKETVLMRNTSTQQLDDYREYAWGGESQLRGVLFDRHHVKLGVRAVRSQSGNNVTLPITSTGVIVVPAGTNYLISSPGKDVSRGVFAEDRYDVLEKTSLIVGGSVDDNGLRVKKAQFSSRLGLVQSIGKSWSVKYLYHTGFLLPDMLQGRQINAVSNAVKAEKTASHDVQLAYNTPATQANLVVFQTEVKDYIVNVGGAYANSPDKVKLHGLEFELRRRLTGYLSLYGNYAYALAKLDDDTVGLTTGGKEGWVGMPHQLYNVGTDWTFPRGVTFNLHLRGWKDAVVDAYDEGLGTSRLQDLPGEYYLDGNLVLRDVFGTPFTTSIYGTNLLNHGGANPVQQLNGGWVLEKGRSVGVKVSCPF